MCQHIKHLKSVQLTGNTNWSRIPNEETTNENINRVNLCFQLINDYSAIFDLSLNDLKANEFETMVPSLNVLLRIFDQSCFALQGFRYTVHKIRSNTRWRIDLIVYVIYTKLCDKKKEKNSSRLISIELKQWAEWPLTAFDYREIT